MTDPIRSALKRLLSAVLDGLGQDDHPMGWARVDDAIDAACAALAEHESGIPKNCWLDKAELKSALAKPEPEGPTVMQLIELSDETEAAGLGQVYFARAVLARWGTPNLAETRSSLGDALQPVPVSERLPGDQLCWWYEPDEDDDGSGYGGNWTLLRIRGAVSYYTHWLPAHALPLPTAND